MQKTKVTDNIEFAYHDSGAPSAKGDDYYTIIVIHGLMFHSGTFSRMLEQANSFGYRMILPNRRLYPGSTPYTPEETHSFGPENSTEEIKRAFLKQGEYLLLFINSIIKEHDLEKVILVGWSLGAAFLSSTVYSITTVADDVKARLVQTVKSIVLWDPPSAAFGIPPPPSGDWVPLLDETLTPEQRGQAFGEWIVQYFPHPEIDRKDCYTFIYKMTTPIKPPTFSDITFEEFLTKVDLTAGPNGDTHVVDNHFQSVVKSVKKLALFNLGVREAWGNTPFNIIYGEESTYTVVWAAWQLEAEAEKTGLSIKIQSMPGANHFAMHDLTKLSFDTLHACL